MKNVTAFSTSVSIVSTVTFPFGFQITQFSDDEDPIKFNEKIVQGTKVLLNGKILAYKTAKPIEVSISVIPGSEDDKMLSLLQAASNVKNQLIPVEDTVVMTISYPNEIAIYNGGALVAGPAGKSVKTSGRFASNTYRFVFTESISF